MFHSTFLPIVVGDELRQIIKSLSTDSNKINTLSMKYTDSSLPIRTYLIMFNHLVGNEMDSLNKIEKTLQIKHIEFETSLLDFIEHENLCSLLLTMIKWFNNLAITYKSFSKPLFSGLR